MMEIKVNNKIQQIENEISLNELLKLNNVEMPEMVSVQINEKFVKKDKYSDTKIKEGDSIDFLYFMGGGSF